MNFFERQRRVRTLSRRLVLLFALAVLGIVVVVDAAVILGFQLQSLPVAQLATVLAVVSVLTMILIGATSVIRMALLRNSGGGRVARQLGGVYVPEDTTDPSLRRLRNVVEEMAIASAVPVPEVYVLERESAINAFAAGWSPADAAVAVTRGALERLNRDELQGVIGHEFSHVVNGDMRLNLRLMGLLFGILALAVIGRLMLQGSRGDRKNGTPIALVGLAALLAGYIGVFFGRLIKAAVSRQREYLADASAVQYTRQTTGITGALKKIAGLPSGSRLANGNVEDVSHMLFGDGLRLSSWFATHPPLPERIKVLDPAFDPAELRALTQRWVTAPPSGLAEDQALGLAAEPSTTEPRGPHVRVDPGQVVASIATPEPDSHRRAAAVLDRIPQRFLTRARQPDTVVPLVFGLLMAADPETRYEQHTTIAVRHGMPLADAALAEAESLARLRPALRLPLVQVGFSALRRRPLPELELILGTVSDLTRVDGQVSVFEYCLSRLLYQELYESMNHAPPLRGRRQTLARSQAEVVTLLSTLALIGQPNSERARVAYRAGAALILPEPVPDFTPPGQGVVALDAIWPRLDALDSVDKQRLVASLVTAISHDGVMTVEEVELLRTVCGLLHCPVPPLAETSVPSPA
ncbi:MAG TPA: M48 family metallopeptidase [Micromonosporaceae bacterium]|jgi:Zn-dependent protease with chaperone function|nr:M48 family metallopeptidase [Micromonosporaceae bacterium]